MIVGVKYLTWAPYASGGDGAAVAYGTGSAESDKIVHVDMGEERADEGFYADDHRIDRDNSVTGATLAVEVAKLTAAMKEGMLGHVKGTGDEYAVTDAASPFVGVGFVLKDRYKGAYSYVGYWYYKMQFSEGQRSFNTKGETLAYQTESLEGDAEAVKLAADGPFTFYSWKDFDSENAAHAWVKGKAGING